MKQSSLNRMLSSQTLPDISTLVATSLGKFITFLTCKREESRLQILTLIGPPRSSRGQSDRRRLTFAYCMLRLRAGDCGFALERQATPWLIELTPYSGAVRGDVPLPYLEGPGYQRRVHCFLHAGEREGNNTTAVVRAPLPFLKFRYPRLLNGGPGPPGTTANHVLSTAPQTQG